MYRIFWCSLCFRELDASYRTLDRTWGHLSPSGDTCKGAVVAWDECTLPDVDGWQLTPPARPGAPSDGVSIAPRELWWFYGVRRDHPYRGPEMNVVENCLLGAGDRAWQAILYHSDFTAPNTLLGYWRRCDTPVPPPAFAVPIRVR